MILEGLRSLINYFCFTCNFVSIVRPNNSFIIAIRLEIKRTAICLAEFRSSLSSFSTLVL